MSNVLLEGVQDTLFIPLMARKYVSKTFPEYFYDEKAIEIANKLPPNSIIEKSTEYQLITSVCRSVTMDNLIEKFILKQQKSNIVFIGCGLETTVWRLAKLKNNADFYGVDFQSVIEQRKNLLGVCDNENLIVGDANALNFSKYMDINMPTLFVVSGVFEYFREEDVLKLIKKLQHDFKNSEIIFDAISKMGLKIASRYVKKTGNKEAEMHFSVNNGKDFAKLSGTKLIGQCKMFSTITEELKNKLELYTRVSMFVNDYKNMSMILHLEL